MGLKELLEKLRGEGGEEEEVQELPDDMTRDKVLRSLRRQMRVLSEEDEKEFLRKKIKEIQRQKLRKHLFGIAANNIVKTKMKRKAKNILRESSGFLGKSNL